MEQQKTIEEQVQERFAIVLQELNSQLLRTEIQKVADKAGVNSRNTVVSYLEGKCPKPETAQAIIRAAREIIIEREQSLTPAA